MMLDGLWSSENQRLCNSHQNLMDLGAKMSAESELTIYIYIYIDKTLCTIQIEIRAKTKKPRGDLGGKLEKQDANRTKILEGQMPKENQREPTNPGRWKSLGPRNLRIHTREIPEGEATCQPIAKLPWESD